MTWTGHGKVAVTSAGTPVPLATTKTKVHSIIITYDPADTGAVYVKDVNGNIMNAIKGAAAPVILLESHAADEIDLATIQIDVETSGQGPYVSHSVV